MRSYSRLALTLLATATAASAQTPFDSLHFRSIGPAATGGRIHDIEVDPTNPAVMYVAAATGGIWKTTNHGTSWEPTFENMPENTFGDLAIFQPNPQIIWAGSGEQNNRQSSSWGSGVYRSTDAGKTWSHIGLDKTASIGRVKLHPTDPNIAYVAAVGNLWKATPDRGLYKTTDAGRTWAKVLYVDSLTGATDVAIDPRDPNVIYAATYQRIRSAFGFNGGGPGSGIWKSTDAGATWNRIENGIPAGDKGRIQFDISRSNPNVLIALVEAASPQATGTYRTEDAGATWKMVSRNNPRPMYFSKPFIDPTTDKRVWELGVTVYKSEDGGATFVNMPNSPTYDVGLKTDHHTLWIDPANPRHTILGGDGGLNESWDLGLTYRRLNQIPNGQFYHIAVDDRDPYYIYGGLQDNHSWMGPSATRHWLGILNQDWVQIGFSDGTGQAVDKNNWRYVYTSSSGGNVTRFDPLTGDRFDIKPVPPKGDSAYRWDWDSPLVASQHKAGTVYIGGNRLFISKDYGNSWTATKDLTKQINRDTLMLGGILDRDVKISKNDGDAISEITAIAESPLDMKVLWVGTDDGNVQLSTDGGASWTELSSNIRGVPGLPFVARIIASSANKGTALVAFDQHRSGDFAPYIVRTTDFGKTWRPVVNGLAPDASVRSIYEYPGRANVVFAGTERAFYISRDSGSTWSRLKANLPTTRYDDMLIHPRTHDLVVATHGRSLWILDDASVLADFDARSAAPQLFQPARATLQLFWEDISNLGHGEYTGENPADGAVFTYYLPSAAQNVKFVVRNSDNKVVRELTASAAGGVVQRINWDLRWPPAPGFGGRGGGGGEEGGGGDTGGGRGVVQLPIPAHDIGNRGIFVSPGKYTVTMVVGTDSTSRTFEVRSDPLANVTVKDQKAREAFLLDILVTQQQIQSAVAALRAKAQGATGDSATKLQAWQRRLTQANARIGRIPSGFNGSGAQQGSFAPPGPMLRSMLAEAKDELAAVKKEAGIP